jgi:replicative DNA helicase
VNTAEAQVIVAKQRNGATGTVVVGWDEERTRFYDREARP